MPTVTVNPMKRFTLRRTNGHGVVLEEHRNIVGRFIMETPPFRKRIRRCEPWSIDGFPEDSKLRFVQWIYKDGGPDSATNTPTTWEACDVQTFQRDAGDRADTHLLHSVAPPLQPPQPPGARPVAQGATREQAVVYERFQRWRRDNYTGKVTPFEVLPTGFVEGNRVVWMGAMVRLRLYGSGTPADSDPVPNLHRLSMFRRDATGAVVAEGQDYVSAGGAAPLWRCADRYDDVVVPVGPPLVRLGTEVGGWRRVVWDFRMPDKAMAAAQASITRAARERQIHAVLRCRYGLAPGLAQREKRAADEAALKGLTDSELEATLRQETSLRSALRRHRNSMTTPAEPTPPTLSMPSLFDYGP